MRHQDHIVELQQLGMHLGLVLEDVQSGTRDPALAQRGRERRFVDDRPSRAVDEVRRVLHRRQLLGTDQMVRGGPIRTVQRHDVGDAQQLVEIDAPGAQLGGGPGIDLDELLSDSDVVSLHCPYGPATHHLIGAEQLAAMQDSAYLVNTARGPIVDEAALASALREGRIAGAGLDVYEHEPRVHPELRELDNVVLLPHLGSATVETRTAMAVLAADNVLAVLGGQRPPTPIG